MNENILISIISVIGTIIVAIITYLLQPVVKAWIEKQKRRKIGNEYRNTLPKLKYHQIFKSFIDWKHFYKYVFDLGDAGRTKIAQEHMYNKMDAWEKTFLEYSARIEACTTTCQGDKTNCAKFRSTCIEMANVGVERSITWCYVGKSDIHTANKYDEASYELMTSVFFPKFTRIHSVKEKMLKKIIEDVSEADYFTSRNEDGTLNRNCNVRFWYILTSAEYLFIETQLDSERTMLSINGDFTGKAFLGTIVGPCRRRNSDHD